MEGLMTEGKSKIPTRKKLLLTVVIATLLGGGGYIYITRFHNPCENKYLAYEEVKDYKLIVRPANHKYTFPSSRDAKGSNNSLWLNHIYENNCRHRFEIRYLRSVIDDHDFPRFKGIATYQNNQWVVSEDNNKGESK